MRILRTPDECFDDLPGFPHAPRYADVPDGEGGRLRMVYVDVGPADGPVALLLHGEPTWSYLYRHVIDTLAAAGIRSVAVDLIGFGPPTSPPAHTTTRTPGTWSGCAPWSSTCWASGASRSWARTGAA